MPAAVTDKFLKVGVAGTLTTLQAPGKALAAASITVGSTTNWPTDTGVLFAIRVVDSNGDLVAGTYTEWVGTVSGTTISGLTGTPAYGTDQVYAAGSTTQVYIPVSAYAQNRLIDGILVEHDQDGTHGNVTTTSLSNAGTLTQTGVGTFTTHIDVNDASTAIRDSSDNELVKFAKTASAVNEIEITNNSTGNAPKIAATGGDTNVSLNLASKGTGEVQINGTAMSGAWTSWTPTYTNITVGNGTVVAKYKQIGKVVYARFEFTLGTTSAVGTDPKITFPVTAISAVNFTPLGFTSLFDTSSSLVVAGYFFQTSTTVGQFNYEGTAGGVNQYGGITATLPFTWATGDRIAVQFSYEAA